MPSLKNRIISSLSYLTSGLVGFIWLIVSHIRHDRLSAFTRFHIFQSIFIFIFIYVVGLVLNILLGIVQIMPLIGPLVVNINLFLTKWPVILGHSLTESFIIALSLYLAISAFLGRYGEVPWVSDTVRKM